MELFKLCYKIIMVIMIVIMIIITLSNCQNLEGEYECQLTDTDKKHVNGKIMRICTYSKNLTASCYTHIINGLNYYTFYNLYVHHCYNLQFLRSP